MKCLVALCYLTVLTGLWQSANCSIITVELNRFAEIISVIEKDK